MQRSWNARSRIVSRGPDEELESGIVESDVGAWELMLLRSLMGELSADDLPWADVHPSINSPWYSPTVVAGDGRSLGKILE